MGGTAQRKFGAIPHIGGVRNTYSKEVHFVVFFFFQEKCKLRHPPGNEIYRKGSISFFEIDGRKNKVRIE